VAPGEPLFRIAAISRPSDHPDVVTRERTGVFVRPGQSDVWIGVVSRSLPTDGALLSVTGDGVTVGPTVFKPNRFLDGSHVMSVLLRVSSDATAGLRSLVVRQGANLAYANGYLEILPAVPDFNFDGLDDTFQRKFFSLFTASEAGPGADPDGDGYDNLDEYRTGSDPTDPRSLNFRILNVTPAVGGVTISWESRPGRRYQVFTRSDYSSASWQAIGDPVVGSGDIARFSAPAPTNAIRFYRVQKLP
jgi:hypothetical protein